MRCPECGGIEAEGCLCSFCDSDGYEIAGDGNEDTCFTVEPIIDPDEDNLFEKTSAGLRALLPSYILNPPACHIYNSADIPLPNDSATKLTFDNVRYDTDNMTVTDDRITIVTPGVYIVTLGVEFNKNDVGDRAIFIRLDGSDFVALSSVHAGDADLYVGLNATYVDEFAGGQFLEAYAKQDSGASLNVLSDRFSPVFTASFRRRATE